MAAMRKQSPEFCWACSVFVHHANGCPKTAQTEHRVDNTGVLKAITIVGSQSKLARLMNVKRATIYYWLLHGVPPNRVGQLTTVCGPKLRKHDVRPDLW